MKSICQDLLRIGFLLLPLVQNNLEASMVREDSFGPARGFSEDYPSPSDTADTLASGFLQNSKKLPDSSFYPKIDLIFILDSSSNVGPGNFNKIKQFVSDLIQEFSVNPSATQIAVVSYGQTPRLDFPLNKYVNRECSTNATKSLRFIGERPSLEKALRLVSDSVLNTSQGSRGVAKKIVFLITGGQENLKKMEAESFEWQGVSFYVMAIGPRSFDPFLQNIASPPSSNHFFRVRTFNDLKAISNKIKGKGARRLCSGSSTVYDECNRQCKCSNGELTHCYRIRKEFTAMSLEERKRFITAFITVSSKQPYQKMYNKLTKVHPGHFDAIHVRDIFFPFHRWYILQLENLLRRVDCRVTVPYWHWSRAVPGNHVFRGTHIRDVWYPGEHGLGGNGTLPKSYVPDGPFACGLWKEPKGFKYPCLKRVFAAVPELSEDKYVQALFKYPREQFLCFEYATREFLHNDMHHAIGGTMMLDESANTPEFWLHHGFLDKLWSDWQKRGESFKLQFYKTVKAKMPDLGNGQDGWLYADLDNQPGCVQVAYEDSENFYNNRKISEDETKMSTFSTQRDKRTTMSDDAMVYKQYDDNDDDYDDDDDDDSEDEGDGDDHESKEEKLFRKSCNMDDNGGFTINGTKFFSYSRKISEDATEKK